MRWVEIRPEERTAAAGAFFTLLAITAAHTLIETARDALFLAKLPASQLAWVYLGIAAVGLAFSRLQNKRARLRIGRPLLVSAAITGAFWALAASGLKNTLFLYSLYLWSGIFASWVIVQFWLLLGAAFTVGQAKRLFGLIGTGSVLGAVIGAGSARALAETLAAEHLLAASAIILALTAVGPSRLLKGIHSDVKTGAKTRLKDDLALVRENPYTRRLLAMVLTSTVAFTLIDYLFKAHVAASVPDEELGAFFANIYVVLNAIALVVQVFAVAGLLRAFGVHRVILILPLLITFGSVGLIAGGSMIAALILKGFDGALRHSMHRTSAELLYVPLPDVVRPRAKPFIDLVGQRGGQAIASAAILISAAAGIPSQILAIMVLLLALFWIFVALGIQRHYLDMFRAAIWEGRIDDRGDLPALDLNALEALMAALNSTKDAEVICALELLAAQRRQRLIPALILYHPSRAVVLRALELLSQEKRADFAPIAERLTTHADPDVRAAAVRARLAVAPDQSWLEKMLHENAVEVRVTALVAAISKGWIDAEEAAKKLRELTAGADRSTELALARAGAQDPSPMLEDVLIELSKRGDPELAMEAAWAMGKTKAERMVPHLMPLLIQRVPGAAAREAMVEIGEPALDALDRALSDPKSDPALKVCLPRAIGQFSPQVAAPILMRHLKITDDGLLRYRILRTLQKVRAAAPETPLDEAQLLAHCEEATRKIVDLLSWQVTIERDTPPHQNTPALSLISKLLGDKERHALGRLFLLFGLLYPGESFARIQRGLASKNAKMRATSRELIENLVDPGLKAVLTALLEELSPAERLQRLPATHRPQPRPLATLLQNFLDRDDELGSLAHYHAQAIGLEVSKRRRSASGAFLGLTAEAGHV